MTGLFLAGACFAAACFAGAFSAGVRSGNSSVDAVVAGAFFAGRFRRVGLRVASSVFVVRSTAASAAWSALTSAIAASAMSGTAQSMLRRSGAKLTTTSVTDSPSFITLRALVGAGFAIRRSGT